jgi:hypothetical protein
VLKAYLLQGILLQRINPGNPGIAAHCQFGGLKRAVVPCHAGEPMLRTVTFLVGVVRFKQIGVLDLVFNLRLAGTSWGMRYTYESVDAEDLPSCPTC